MPGGTTSAEQFSPSLWPPDTWDSKNAANCTGEPRSYVGVLRCALQIEGPRHPGSWGFYIVCSILDVKLLSSSTCEPAASSETSLWISVPSMC